MKKIKQIISILTIIIMFVTMLNTVAKATNTNLLAQDTGSLEINKYNTNFKNDEETVTTADPVEGARFAIYKVSDIDYEGTAITSTELPVDEKILQTKQTLETNSEGKVKFENLTLGRYLVVEEYVPEGTTGRIANFLIDIPQTNESGNEFIYDVSVSPKNNIAYGIITLVKQGKIGGQTESLEKLSGVKFVLLKQESQLDSSTTWIPYTTNKVPTAEYTTNSQGQITISGLTDGVYGFVESDLGANRDIGYIKDNKTIHQFEVKVDENTKKTVVNPSIITVTNEKPTIEKTIESITNIAESNTKKDEENLTRSANKGDTISYSVEASVPTIISDISTYKITDTIDSNLEIIKNSFEIKGINSNSEEIIPESNYTLTHTTSGFELSLIPSEIKNYSKIIIKYNAIFSSEAEVADKYNNTATLTYSDEVSVDYNGNPNKTTDITTDSSATIYSGGLIIEKRGSSKNGELLSGAKFKIATSKENAQNKEFIKLKNEKGEWEDLEITTDNGIASYYGLSYGTYYLVETVAPEGFNLMNKAQEIIINEDSYKEVITIINKKGIQLPETGGMGTLVFIIIGFITIVAGIFLHNHKFKGKEQK